MIVSYLQLLHNEFKLVYSLNTLLCKLGATRCRVDLDDQRLDHVCFQSRSNNARKLADHHITYEHEMSIFRHHAHAHPNNPQGNTTIAS